MKFRIAVTLIALSVPAMAQSFCMRPTLQNCSLSANSSDCRAENQQKIDEYNSCREEMRANQERRDQQQREIDEARERNSQSYGPNHNCQMLPTPESAGRLVPVCH
jgi:hypothetical protein